MLDSTQFLFLAYINRSGSTLLSYQLNRYDDICVCPEAEILVNLLLRNPFDQISDRCVEKLNEAIENDYKLKFWKLNKIDKENCKGRTQLEVFCEILKQYQNRIKPCAKTIMFKEQNLLRFIVKSGDQLDSKIRLSAIIRDPRAILHSQKKSIVPETGKPFSQNSFTTLHYCKRFFEKLKKAKSLLHVQTIRYEDLVKNTEEELDHYLKWLCLDAKSVSDVALDNFILPFQKSLHRPISDSISVNGLYKWKTSLSNYELKLCEILLDKKASYFNYNVTTTRSLHFKGMFKIGIDLIRFLLFVLKAKVKWIMIS